MNKSHFYALASHSAGRTVTAEYNVLGFDGPAELARELARLEEYSKFEERDFQSFIRFCRTCSDNRAAEFDWQKKQVIAWGYPRGVFCVLADNGHPFVECDDELAALYGL